MRHSLNRRDALRWLGWPAAACTAMPVRLAFAGGEGAPDARRPRLAVVMLRGALDGLAAVPAVGDPGWGSLGREAPPGSAEPLPLDGLFGLHPALSELQRWYQQKELLVMHACASPYRERSHFDAQQLLESGGQQPFELSTGWLGRALQLRGQAGLAMSAAMPLALRGADDASTWTPERQPAHDTDLIERVRQMYQGDPALSGALEHALAQQQMPMDAQASAGLSSLARQAGLFLADPNGPRVAWLEASGWDTHTGQWARLARLLKGLDEALAALRAGLGASWQSTTVLVMTEFGRSAAMNGSGGTDHGTGAMALVAGGQVAGGRVLADWPGLKTSQLLDGRDLRPTQDLRGVLAALLTAQFSLSRSQLQSTVLPGFVGAQPDIWRT